MGGIGSDASLRRAAALAGLMFLASLLVPLLNYVLVFSGFVATDDVVAIAGNVAAHPSLFRVHILAEMATAVIVAVLGAALYVMLEPVHRLLALLALLLKLVEAALCAVLALAHLAALLLLSGRASPAASAQDRVGLLVGLLLDAHMPLTAVPGMFLGLASVVFLYLLFRSRYVPDPLAAFGVLSYALVFFYDLTLVVAPGYAAMTVIQVVGWGPSILFELLIGPWLLLKGVAPQPRALAAPGALEHAPDRVGQGA